MVASQREVCVQLNMHGNRKGTKLMLTTLFDKLISWAHVPTAQAIRLSVSLHVWVPVRIIVIRILCMPTISLEMEECSR